MIIENGGTVSRSKNAFLNVVCLIILQLLVACSGLVLPRLIIGKFGSEVNGLISSITQFLSYISLLEAGVGGVISAALYKPLANGDQECVSGIIKATSGFYKKIGLIFVVYVIGLCGFYPFIIKTSFDWFFIVSLILILSVETALQYFFSLPYISLVAADQKARVNYIVSSITVVFNFIFTYLLIQAGASIQVVKLTVCLIFTLKPFFYKIYIKKFYQLNEKAIPNHDAIKQRWNGLGHHIAYFIHINTDVALITLFLGVKQVSVYAVYYAIVSGIQKIVVSVSTGSAAGIGNLLAKSDMESANKVVDRFEFLQSALSTVVFTITALMLIPFITLYTKGISDVDYKVPLFGYSLIVVEAMYCNRCIYSNIIYAANHYKQTQCGAFFEAGTNIIVSVILIQFLGLVGVAIGTLMGTIVRILFDLYHLSKNIIQRPMKRALKMFLINILVCLSSIAICIFILDYFVVSWGDWILLAIITSCLVIVVAIIFYFLFSKKNVISILKTLRGLLLKK